MHHPLAFHFQPTRLGYTKVTSRFGISTSKLVIAHCGDIFSGSGNPRIATLAFLLIFASLCSACTTSYLRLPVTLLLNCKSITWNDYSKGITVLSWREEALIGINFAVCVLYTSLCMCCYSIKRIYMTSFRVCVVVYFVVFVCMWTMIIRISHDHGVSVTVCDIVVSCMQDCIHGVLQSCIWCFSVVTLANVYCSKHHA